MKKNLVKGLLLLSVFFVMSCKSTQVEDAPDKAGKNYVGWVDSTGKDVVYKDGIVQIKIKQNLGTFNIGVLNENEKVIPVLSTAEEFTSSAFYLKTSKKTYLLRKDGIIKSSASRTKNGINLTYSVDKAFDMNVAFDIMDSKENNVSDMLKVVYTIKNTGTKRDDFSLKAIFDTVLGETDKYHFYTSDNNPVKNEVLYRTMQNQKWVVSRNKSAAVEFIFNGGDTTAPEVVALANYSTFQKNSWEPEMLSYRAFDTVLSYNNSALGVIWPSVKLKPSESTKIVFYMSFATDGDEPAGHKLICKEKVEEEKKVLVEETVKVVPAQVEVAVPVVEEKVPVKAPEKMIETPVEPEPLPEEVEETVNGLTKEQLSPEYIQRLIDRISELEQDSAKIQSNELQQLNDELDEILSALR